MIYWASTPQGGLLILVVGGNWTVRMAPSQWGHNTESNTILHNPKTTQKRKHESERGREIARALI